MQDSIGFSSPKLITLFEVPGDTVSEHLQDAPPSVGASEGEESSNTVSSHELIPPPEEDTAEITNQPDGPGDVVSEH